MFSKTMIPFYILHRSFYILIMSRITEITNKEKYDSLWESQKGHVLQSWAWGETRKESWQPLRIKIETDAGKMVVTMLRRTFLSQKINFAYIPKLTLLAGAEDMIISEIKVFAKNLGLDFVLVEFDDYAREYKIPKVLEITGEETIQPNYTTVVDLESVANDDELALLMKKKFRQNYRKAEKLGLAVQVFEDSTAPIDKLSEIIDEIADEKHFLAKTGDYLQTVWKELNEDHRAVLFVAKKQEEIQGIYLIPYSSTTAFQFYGGVTPAGRNNEAGYLLKWEMLRFAKRKGLKYFDMWGTAPYDEQGEYEETHELYRVSRFKHGFGGKQHTFPKQRVLIINPWKYRLYQIINLGRKLVIKLKKSN